MSTSTEQQVSEMEAKYLIGTLIYYVRVICLNRLTDPRYTVKANIINDRLGDHSQRIFTMADFLTRAMAEQLIKEGANKNLVFDVLREFCVSDVAFPGEADEIVEIVP